VTGSCESDVAARGDEVETLDELAEADTNAERGTPIARWRFLHLAGTKICGWVPRRA
jgi:hypothetical protein